MQTAKRPYFNVENDDNIEDANKLSTPHSEPSAYCRLCFSITLLEPVFRSSFDRNIRLTSLVELSTGIKLEREQDINCSICRQCYDKMIDFRRFRKLSQTLNKVVLRERKEIQPVTETDVDPSALANIEQTSGDIDHNTSANIDLTMSDHEGNHSRPEYIGVNLDGDEDGDVECTGVIQLPQTPHTDYVQADNYGLPFMQIGPQLYRCNLCFEIKHQYDLMITHIYSVHPEIGVSYDPQIVQVGSKVYYKCNSCDALFCQKRNIRKHSMNYHSDNVAPARKIYCTAPGCGCFFMESYGYSRHMKLFHDYSE